MTALEQHESRSVLEHIGELRRKLFIALAAVTVGAVIGQYFHKRIIAFLLKPIGTHHLVFLSPFEPVFFVFKIDCIVGVIIAFPVIVWCVFSYITPAFSKQTKKLLSLFYISSTVLLLGSLAYAFFVTVPFTLHFLLSVSFNGIQNLISVENYLSFITLQATVMVIIFQLPVLVIGGAYIGAFKTSFLSSKRRYVYLFLTIGLSFLSPTPDFFSFAMILLPCLLIFEISLLGGKMVERMKRKKKEVQAEVL